MNISNYLKIIASVFQGSLGWRIVHAWPTGDSGKLSKKLLGTNTQRGLNTSHSAFRSSLRKESK